MKAKSYSAFSLAPVCHPWVDVRHIWFEHFLVSEIVGIMMGFQSRDDICWYLQRVEMIGE
jgi:hypothetical protein